MAWAQHVSEGITAFSLPLIAQALCNHTLRQAIIRQLEKRIVTEIRATTGSSRPAQVLQDKIDLARAMLRSFARALERKQVCRTALRGILRRTLANYVSALQDHETRNATKRFAERHQGQLPPSSIAIGPTKACNLRCTGCYASAEPSTGRLEWDVLDRIVTEAKTQWGLRFFTIVGGEPLVYRSQGRDIVDWANKHSDCLFLIYTNGILIDARMAERMAQAGNVTPAISLEGFEARTDQRRGAGVFQRVLAAMARLRQAGVLFGVSLTATRENAEEILSDEFINFLFNEQQAVYGWLFQYMPIGRGYTLELLVTPEQRLWMWERTWQILRQRQIMLIDFWNCGTLSEGCAAAGKPGGYLYIDWNGKVMPCVFNPFSGANIHEIYSRGGTLDDLYDLPYFRAIRQWQGEYGLEKKCPEEHGNWLLPCPLRDHYAIGRNLIETHRPEPEDDSAADSLLDQSYSEGWHAYNQHLQQLFDPVWDEQYLKKSKHQYEGQERTPRVD